MQAQAASNRCSVRRDRRAVGDDASSAATGRKASIDTHAGTRPPKNGINGPAQRMRPLRRENHLGPGMIRLGAGRRKQVRNPPRDRGRRIDPVDRPGRKPHQPVQQQRIMRAGQHDGIGARRSPSPPRQAGRQLGGDFRDRLTSAPLKAASASEASSPIPPASLRSPARNRGSARACIRAARCPWCRARRRVLSSIWRRPA